MAAQDACGVPLCTLNPKFLHTNSTSHTWPFGAIAELIDNAYDPDVSAKQFWIDKTVVKGVDCLSFMDNGAGLDYKMMLKMLSFGFSDKTAVNGKMPIGFYGNGFKSGSMRLGKDAIVFSKSRGASCVGMLSQTYLEKINAEKIVVPIVSFEHEGSGNLSVRERDQVSLEHILSYSPFTTQKELLDELKAITRMGETGTRIIIWNLRRTSTGELEFDFRRDRYDIQIPSEVFEAENGALDLSHVPESRYSLRAYCSLLYLKPRLQINIRSLKVKSELIAKSLASTRKDRYKPNFLENNTRIPITFGYNTKNRHQFGLMMYYKNRLIKAYERVGCQLRADRQGAGVIGIVECNYLKPTHNKQSFDETDQYRKTMMNVTIKLEEYCKEIQYDWRRKNPNNSQSLEDTIKRPDQEWAQCEACSQWRKLPDGVNPQDLPENWFCHMNPDPQFRNCQVAEEAEDSDEDQPAYSKTFKRQEKIEKKKRQMKKQKEEEERACAENQKMAALARQNAELQQQLRKRPARAVSAPTPPNDSRQGPTLRAQAVTPSSRNDGLPVISGYFSLSAVPRRAKRKRPPSPQTTPRRVIAKSFHGSASDTSNSTDAWSPSSPSLLAGHHNLNDDPNDDHNDDHNDEHNDHDNDHNNDHNGDLNSDHNDDFNGDHKGDFNDDHYNVHNDDFNDDHLNDHYNDHNDDLNGDVDVILENAGTSMSSPPATEIIKTEEESMLLELIDDTFGGSNGPADPPGPTSSTTTQTEAVRVKREAASASQTAEVAGQSTAHIVEHRSQACGTEAMVIKEEPCSQGTVPNGVAHLADDEESAETSAHQPPDEIDYKYLYEEAKKSIDQLVVDKVALLAAAESRAAPPGGREGEESDEVAMEVDLLKRQLAERQKENDELWLQMDILKEEKANMAAQCEKLRWKLQQKNGNPEEGTSHSAAGATLAGEGSSSDAFRSLIELRQNVGRLLITHVPYLELEQVNFECNVIDEILEQYLTERDIEGSAPNGNGPALF